MTSKEERMGQELSGTGRAVKSQRFRQRKVWFGKVWYLGGSQNCSWKQRAADRDGDNFRLSPCNVAAEGFAGFWL